MSVEFPSVEALRKLKAAQERYVLILGLGIGVTLVLYFFTFAQVIDRGYTGVLWFQAVSSIVMVAALFMLKRLAFCLVRLLHGRRSPYREILARIAPSDLDQEPEKLVEKLVAGGRSR
jgi:hypothetical protein